MSSFSLLRRRRPTVSGTVAANTREQLKMQSLTTMNKEGSQSASDRDDDDEVVRIHLPSRNSTLYRCSSVTLHVIMCL